MNNPTPHQDKKLNVNKLERIIADHNKEMRVDMASEITGGTRSKSITDVITVEAIVAWADAYALEQVNLIENKYNNLSKRRIVMTNSTADTTKEFDEALHQATRLYRAEIANIVIKFKNYHSKSEGKELLDEAIDAADKRHEDAIKQFIADKIIGELSAYYYIADKYEDDTAQEAYEHGVMDTINKNYIDTRKRLYGEEKL